MKGFAGRSSRRDASCRVSACSKTGQAPSLLKRISVILERRMKFYPIDIKSADWKRLDGFADRTVFQTREWLQFIAEAQNAQPVLAELRDKSEVLGYFTGLTFSKLGMKVLGSSFPGWTTPYIGFNLSSGVSRRDALEALEKLAWDDLKCLHVEVSDPNFSVEDGETAGFKTEYYASYRTDLTRSEEELFNGMESACRRCIRKAERAVLRSKRRTISLLPTNISSNSRMFLPSKVWFPPIPWSVSALWFATSSPVETSCSCARVIQKGNALPPESILASTRLPNSGVTPVFVPIKTCVRTKPVIGTLCAIGKSAAFLFLTGAAKARTKKSTDARHIACHGSPSLVTRS